MSVKPSRRTVAAALLGSPALAQAPPAPGAQEARQAAQPSSAEELRAAASRQVQSTAAVLRKFEIPIETEPAFHFRP